jgi:PQQ enzyme-like repeat protein
MARGAGMRRLWNSTAVMAILCALVAGAVPAWAATGDAPTPTWQTNGRVLAVAYSGTTVYLAGTFTSVRPPGNRPGVGEVARNRAAAFDTTTGQLLAWNPNVNGEVRALAVAGQTVYLGGGFSRIGSSSRRRLAAVHASSGLATSWNPNVSAKVNALATDGSTVWLGGTFTSVGGSTRLRLAAVSATTAAPTSFRADVDGEASGSGPYVNALVLHGSGLYVAGAFSSIGGVNRTVSARVDPASGAVGAWSAATRYTATAIAVAPDGARVYVGGRGPGGYVAAFSAATGATIWSRNPDGDVQALTATTADVYIGGHFDVVGGLTRHHLANLGPTNGAVGSWDPGADSSEGAFVLATDNRARLWVGGEFTQTGDDKSIDQQGFAQYAIS